MQANSKMIGRVEGARWLFGYELVWRHMGRLYARVYQHLLAQNLKYYHRNTIFLYNPMYKILRVRDALPLS